MLQQGLQSNRLECSTKIDDILINTTLLYMVIKVVMNEWLLTNMYAIYNYGRTNNVFNTGEWFSLVHWGG